MRAETRRPPSKDELLRDLERARTEMKRAEECGDWERARDHFCAATALIRVIRERHPNVDIETTTSQETRHD